MSAPSKDDVYSELRKQGIRAIRVDERIAPVVRRGFRGLTKKGWLMIAGVAVFLALAAAAVSWMMAVRTAGGSVASLRAQYRLANSRPRHQMSGVDVLGIAEDAFAHRSEAWLARLAQPGIILGGSPTRAELQEITEDLADSLEDEIVIGENDSRELVDLKRVVSGMKDEVRMFVRGGKNIGEAVDYLIGRCRMEMRYAADIMQGEGTAEEKSEKLRAMGLPDMGAK